MSISSYIAKQFADSGGFFINTHYSNETLSRFSHTRFRYKRYEPEELISLAEKAGLEAEAAPVLRGAAYCYICKKASRDRRMTGTAAR